MTQDSTTLPEQSSRFNNVVIGTFMSTMIVLAGFCPSRPTASSRALPGFSATGGTAPPAGSPEAASGPLARPQVVEKPQLASFNPRPGDHRRIVGA